MLWALLSFVLQYSKGSDKSCRKALHGAWLSAISQPKAMVWPFQRGHLLPLSGILTPHGEQPATTPLPSELSPRPLAGRRWQQESVGLQWSPGPLITISDTSRREVPSELGPHSGSSHRPPCSTNSLGKGQCPACPQVAHSIKASHSQLGLWACLKQQKHSECWGGGERK